MQKTIIKINLVELEVAIFSDLPIIIIYKAIIHGYYSLICLADHSVVFTFCGLVMYTSHPRMVN